MHGFARVTKLGNIGGRADYISNPKRQEHIVAKSESVDWKPYHEFEIANQKSATRNNEGREVVSMLPNEWADLPEPVLQERAQRVAVAIAGKSTDMQWAVHWNKVHTNLHIHVIFSERQIEKNPKRWDRDIYLTDEGKIARRKADRAKNPDGSTKPPVHKKGDLKGGFTAKDTRYTERSWVKDTKANVERVLRFYRADLERPEPLHQYHEGKGRDSSEIHQKNLLIKQNNEVIKKLSGELPDFPMKRLKEIALGCLKENSVIKPEMIADELEKYGYPRSALNLNPRPEPSQNRPESISRDFATVSVEKPQKPQKPKFETISGAVECMETSLQKYLSSLHELNRCKFYEFGKKKDLRQQVDAHADDYKQALGYIKAHGYKTDFCGLYEATGNPKVVETLKEQLGLTKKAEQKSVPHRDSRNMSLDDAMTRIKQQKEKDQERSVATRTKSHQRKGGHDDR